MRAEVVKLPPFVFGGLALTEGRQSPHDLVGGAVFDVGGDGPLVAVGVGDAGEAVAVELAGGLRDGRFQQTREPCRPGWRCVGRFEIIRQWGKDYREE